MSAGSDDLYADTVFWLALVIRQDALHARAQAWVRRISGRIITSAVLLEAANALSRPVWRAHAVRLIEDLKARKDIDIVQLDASLLDRGWGLYRDRPDKSWSWTDCISFLVMEDRGITVALTSDRHFEQAGFRALLLEQPS